MWNMLGSDSQLVLLISLIVWFIIMLILPILSFTIVRRRTAKKLTANRYSTLSMLNRKKFNISKQVAIGNTLIKSKEDNANGGLAITSEMFYDAEADKLAIASYDGVLAHLTTIDAAKVISCDFLEANEITNNNSVIIGKGYVLHIKVRDIEKSNVVIRFNDYFGKLGCARIELIKSEFKSILGRSKVK